MAECSNSIAHWRRQRLRLQLKLQQTACCSLDNMSAMELDRRLGRLCNELMDYLSTGHSSIYARYYRIESGPQDAQAPERKRLLKEIWLHLGRTTDAALRFNLRCETTPLPALQQKLHTELGKLNKTLALRFALEEQLLELASSGTPLAQKGAPG